MVTGNQHLATSIITLLVECILGRNPSFKPRDIIATMNPSPELVKIIKEQFN